MFKIIVSLTCKASAVALVLSFLTCANVYARRQCFNVKLPVPPSELEWSKLAFMPIKTGDFVMMQDGSGWIADSSNDIFSVRVVWGILRVARISKNLLSDPQNILASKFNPNYSKGWSAEQAFALLFRLQDKRLPYGSWFCNESYYMRYIIYMITSKPRYKPSCPLRRNLIGMSVEEIKSENFYLEDGYKKNKVYVDRLKSLKPKRTTPQDESPAE